VLICSNVHCGDPKELCTVCTLLMCSNVHCDDPKKLLQAAQC